MEWSGNQIRSSYQSLARIFSRAPPIESTHSSLYKLDSMR